MTRKRLGELLVEAGLLTVAQLESALAHQQQWGGRIGRIVVQMGFTPEPRMLRILATHIGATLADPPADDLHPRVIAEIPADLATRYMVFPLSMRRDVAGEAIVIAMADPTVTEAIDAVRQHTGKTVYCLLAGDGQIESWIRRHYFREGMPSRPPSDTGIPLVTGAIATPPPQPAPIITPAANPFASAVVQPLTVDDPFQVLDLKPVEVPGSRTSAGMMGIAELQPLTANAEVTDLEPLPATNWSPPVAPVFDTSGGFLSSDDDDVGALPPPSPFATPSFEAPAPRAPVVEPPPLAPSFAGPPPMPAPPPPAPPPAPPLAPPAPPPAPVAGRFDDPFGAVASTIAFVEMPPPDAAPADSWADLVAPSAPAPATAPAPPVPTEPVPPVAVASSATCSRCASPRVEGARFCPFCGLSFVTTSQPPVAAPVAAPSPSAPPPVMASAALPPISAEAMPTPIATGVLILDDAVVEASLARRGTPMPMPSLSVLHAMDAIAAEGPPAPSPFDGPLEALSPGDAPTDAVPVLPDTHPLGDAVDAPPMVVAPPPAPPVVDDPSLQTLELSIIEDPIAPDDAVAPALAGLPAIPAEPDTAAPVAVVAPAAGALDPVTATSVGLTLVAIDPPPDAPAAPDVAAAAPPAPPPEPATPLVAEPPPLDPVTATSVGLTLVAIDVPAPDPPAAALEVEMEVAMEMETEVALDAAPAAAFVEGSLDVEVAPPAAPEAFAQARSDELDDVAVDEVDEVDEVVEVADAEGVDQSQGAGDASALASQWADAAERPIPRQETDTRNAPGWIPPSREILVVPEEAGPAPEPVQAYAPAAAPKASKAAAPWARFAPRAPTTPEPAPTEASATTTAAPAHAEPAPDVPPPDDVAPTLEMRRPVEPDEVDVEPAPVVTARIDRSVLLSRTTDVDGDPALATEPHARPVLPDDEVHDTLTMARPDEAAGTDIDVDVEPALPTLQMAIPSPGLMADEVDLLPPTPAPQVEAWSLSEPARIATPAPALPELTAAPAQEEPNAWTLPAVAPSATPADAPVAAAADTTPPTAAEGEPVELAPWPGSPGAADGPPPMKLTPTMVMRMDPAEQRKLLALLLEKANVGPDVLAKPGDPDKPSS